MIKLVSTVKRLREKSLHIYLPPLRGNHGTPSVCPTNRTTGVADEQSAVRQVSGQAIAAIGAVELPLGMWPGLIGQLLQIINNAEGGVPIRQATLQAIGYLCEST
ncbi:hypothetical protein PSHT_08738 [Puccinia striiformis]|nr:hypothetical protein PSHT_08738 [Puccinia striiformis]